ncbi:MAG: lipopolysaccharide transport periplasmic protein LptA [Gammaproteobacteria bacterium]|nr:lipopolysaccharide transport periplasmic protein LptA [Gammaproteobacteria bacterium]MBQ0839700.1 lipopolysaccharide transport periplasmic protein LptA [Gammaproteobacteria bacterium]
MPTIKFFTSLPGLLCLLGVFFATTTLALPEDRQATITVEADRAQINEKTGITDYQGSVIIKQGTMLIEAEQVTIHSTDGQANKIICIGAPAHYQQQPNPEDGLVNARANTIEYYLDTETITLIKNASLEQQGSILKGDHINYDLKAELVEARGSDNNQQRVHMVIPASQPAAGKTDENAAGEQSPSETTAPEQAPDAQKDSH